MFQITERTTTERLDIVVDGIVYSVPTGISVAAALLLHDIVPFRLSTVANSPRAPYCLMGVCCECLVAINGDLGQLSCQVVVEEGMKICRQQEQ